MTYVNAFIICGFISMIGQIILDNTNLTSGHITSIFVCIGAILSFLGIYDYLTEFSKIGSCIPITSFGNALYQSALKGYEMNGLIGIFENLLTSTSTGISAACLFGFIFSCIFKINE